MVELVEGTGVGPRLSREAVRYYQAAVDAGLGARYLTAIIEVVDQEPREESEP